MVNNETKAVYSEVVGILEMFSPQDYAKIPREVIEFYRWHMDYNYSFKFDYTKSVDEQNISHQAIVIVIALYLKYVGDQQQNKKIYNILCRNELEVNQLKKEKYNPDEIFKDRKIIKPVVNKQLPVKVKEKNLWRKLVDIIKKLVG